MTSRNQIVVAVRILPEHGAPLYPALSWRGDASGERYLCAAAIPAPVPELTCKSINRKHFFGLPAHWHPNCFDNVQTENGLAARSSMIR